MDWQDLRLVARRGPLILEALDDVGVYGAQQFAVECQPHHGGCGLRTTFGRKRRNWAPARRAFKRHARRCPHVPPPTWRRWPLRRLAAVAAVLLLAALAFGAVTSVVSRAGSTPTTTQALYEYIPVPADPSSNTSAGGER
jgi:hypothetical protein